MSDVVERAKAALEGVTEGPWDAFWGDQCCGGTCVDNGHGLPLHSGGDLLPRDARFIAAARTLLPELVAEVERLRLELALNRGGVGVRPMTEVESNLMTQVLDLRRQLAEVRQQATP